MVLYAVPGPVLSSNHHVILIPFPPPISVCYLVAVFELWRLGFIWKNNLAQTVWIHKNNLDHKSLVIINAFEHQKC